MDRLLKNDELEFLEATQDLLYDYTNSYLIF